MSNNIIPNKTNHNPMKFYALLPFLVGATLFLDACSSRGGPPASVQYDSTLSMHHTVKRGESLSSIALKYEMEKSELIRINNLKRPFRVVVGQRLLVRPYGATSEIAEDDSYMPAASRGPSRLSGDVEVTPLNELPAGKAEGVTQQGFYQKQNSQPGLLPAYQPADLDSEDHNRGRQDPATSFSKKESDSLTSGTQTTTATTTKRNFEWPVGGRLVKDFGGDVGKGKKNVGVNIMAPSGSPVTATGSGIVSFAGNQGKYGKVILIKHEDDFMSIYAHLQDINVAKGDKVKIGQKIGTVGTTGVVKSPQVHFELRKGQTPLDPKQYISQ